jgi:hypothetical protein
MTLSHARRVRIGCSTAALVVVFALAGPSAHAATSSVVRAANRSGPSKSAKMICNGEGRADIESSVPSKLLAQPKPKWAKQTYTCNYRFKDGRLGMSVRELSTKAQTDAYFAALRTKLGQAEVLTLGQGAFVTTNGSTVVRKDHKVLLVDVTGLPQKFGKPAIQRSDLSIGVANVIMGCWTGQ